MRNRGRPLGQRACFMLEHVGCVVVCIHHGSHVSARAGPMTRRLQQRRGGLLSFAPVCACANKVAANSCGCVSSITGVSSARPLRADSCLRTHRYGIASRVISNVYRRTLLLRACSRPGLHAYRRGAVECSCVQAPGVQRCHAPLPGNHCAGACRPACSMNALNRRQAVALMLQLRARVPGEGIRVVLGPRSGYQNGALKQAWNVRSAAVLRLGALLSISTQRACGRSTCRRALRTRMLCLRVIVGFLRTDVQGCFA